MHCNVCRIASSNTDDYEEHLESLQHRFNTILYFYNNHRKRFLSEGICEIEVNAELNNNGVSLPSSVDALTLRLEDSKLWMKMTLNRLQGSASVNVDFTMRNITTYSVTLTHINFLHPIDMFKYQDMTGVIKRGQYAELEPGAEYHLRLTFQLQQEIVGNFLNVISLTLQGYKEKVFYVNREWHVEVTDDEETILETTESPFTCADWRISSLVPSRKNKSHMCLQYSVPGIFETLVTMAINNLDLALYQQHCMTMRYMLQKLTANNYIEYNHTLLYLDEVMETISLKQYNMENVTIKAVTESILELTVPGLAEKRPSLITGDYINIKQHDSDVAYEGIITNIKDEVIWIQHLDDTFMSKFDEGAEFEADVRFNLNRLSYVRKHEAIENSKSFMHVLFPQTRIHVSTKHQLNSDDFYNQSIASNPEQREAVYKILNGTNCSAPYIVFGPPGTGKTVTIVESILQLKKRIPNVKILICAPSNAACDNIALKLCKYLKQNEMIRIQAENLDWRLIPPEVLPYCNCQNNVFVRVQHGDIAKYKIVITTLILCGKYRNYYAPDYVFIDEAAQASEPECLIPITLMNPKGKLILCGDPKQLGPITYCKLNTLKKILFEPAYLAIVKGQRFGLGISLLERLDDSGIYDVCPCYTMLVQNFRSHDSLLVIPNRLFYENKLAALSYEAQQDPISMYPFYLDAFSVKNRNNRLNTLGLHAMEFCSIFGNEKREGNSPSYFNQKEIEAVIKYVQSLLNKNVPESDIGVIAPYIRQVAKIRGRLKSLGRKLIEVGSTEAYQGREKRVIIISTVRAKDDLLLYDKKYKLGFVEDERRFNVAITRAKTKLIVIGNPNILQYANTFKTLIKQCIKMDSYYGPAYVERTDDLMKEIMRRMEGMDRAR